MEIKLILKPPIQMVKIPWRNNNFTTEDKDVPLSEEAEIFIGVYLLVLGWLSWLGNSMVILVLYRQRHVLQPTDLLTINLAVSDVSIAVFGYSRGVVEIFNIFKDNGYVTSWIWTCQVNGFVTLLFGLATINTLTAISVTRYIKGCHTNKAHCLSRNTMFISIIIIWMGALFWSMVPLLGWDSYTDSGYGTCEVDWSKAKYFTLYKSFIISLLTTCFIIPVLIILFCNTSILKMKSWKVTLTDSYFYERRKVERDVNRVSIGICTAFTLAWSPYIVVSTCSAWGVHVPNTGRVFVNLLAKSACCYNTFIYLILSSKFRMDVAALVSCFSEPKDDVRLQHFKALKPKFEFVLGDVNQTKVEHLVQDKDSSGLHTVRKEDLNSLYLQGSDLPEYESNHL
ncbi:opsin-5-like [Trichomycterus rosablanca]|uniref:opsin-5-like n=1 Tax=Trichomycterus rosablanca TaxID=2290929 RepID=UPI002F352BCA